MEVVVIRDVSDISWENVVGDAGLGEIVDCSMEEAIGATTSLHPRSQPWSDLSPRGTGSSCDLTQGSQILRNNRVKKTYRSLGEKCDRILTRSWRSM